MAITSHLNFEIKDLNSNARLKRTTYIFLIGKGSRNAFTDEKGTTVCCAGLFIALANLASIYQQIYKLMMPNINYKGNNLSVKQNSYIIANR